MNHLLEDVKISVALAQTADGSSDPDTAVFDMAGYDGIVFLMLAGTITGSGTMALQVKQSASNAVGDALSGASVTLSTSTDSDKIAAVDVYRPKDRYLSASITRATANSVIGGVLAIQYRGRSKPITQSTTYWGDTAVVVVSPAES